MADPTASRSPLGPTVVRLAALWILAGALFKLFVGSPNDLPPVVRETAPELLGISATFVFQLAIAIELSIAVPALLRPRLAWPAVVALFAVFCAILVPLALSGAKSCGCFGSKVIIPPWGMLAIDGTLVLGILLTRPWRGAPARRQLLVPIAAAVIAAWVLPFTLVPSGSAPVAPPAPGEGQAQARPRFVEWRPAEWAGKPLAESGLAGFLDVELYAGDATWVLYSPTCPHCAAYLRRAAGEFELDPKLYVLVELPGDPGMEPEVDLKPPGEEVALPAEVSYVVTPPWVLEVAGGVVTSAEHPAD